MQSSIRIALFLVGTAVVGFALYLPLWLLLTPDACDDRLDCDGIGRILFDSLEFFFAGCFVAAAVLVALLLRRYDRL